MRWAVGRAAAVEVLVADDVCVFVAVYVVVVAAAAAAAIVDVDVANCIQT